jgi:MoxR-like ATPase
LCLPVTSDTPAAEIRGHFIQTRDGFQWVDGPGITAWRTGARLILDEVDKLGDDGLAFSLSLLDNPETAQIHLYQTGETLRPHPEFTCWATMNGYPEDLPPALLDRFPVRFRVDEPHPQAIAQLPDHLRELARGTTLATDERRIGLRAWYAYVDLLASGVSPETCARACLGDRWRDLHQTIQLARAADVR